MTSNRVIHYLKKELLYIKNVADLFPAGTPYQRRVLSLQTYCEKFQNQDLQIPQIPYSTEEHQTWGTLSSILRKNYLAHGCEEVIQTLNDAVSSGLINDKQIPQMKDVSDYMKEKTGWTIKPVKGLVTSRDFLEGMAYKVFPSTVFVRNKSEMLFTPAPDFIHEVFGHCIPLMTPQISEISQLIGQKSLEATDAQILDLAKLYWYTIEIGLLQEKGARKVYGGAILSSISELENAISDAPTIKNMNSQELMDFKHIFQDEEVQKTYFIGHNLDQILQESEDFCQQVFKKGNSEQTELIKDAIDSLKINL